MQHLWILIFAVYIAMQYSNDICGTAFHTNTSVKDLMFVSEHRRFKRMDVCMHGIYVCGANAKLLSSRLCVTFNRRLG